MAQLFSIHPIDPQVRLLRQAAQILDHGGVGAIPTDSCYALACHLDDRAAVDRIRSIRRIDERHHLTLMCRDLSEIAAYAIVDDAQNNYVYPVAAYDHNPAPGHPQGLVEVVADELGPSLRWATATTTRATRSQAKPVPLGRRG